MMLLVLPTFAQKDKKGGLNLKNVLIIGQVDTAEDRYSLEINLTDLFSRYKVKTIPSLNVLKLGSDARELAGDSLQQIVKAKGIDTYVIVSVLGYDRKFKVTNPKDDFETALNQASFYELYRPDIVSISFQFKFFRDGKCIHAEVIKCGNVGSRQTVIKRMRKSVSKQLEKKWL